MAHKNKAQRKANAFFNNVMFGVYGTAHFLFILIRLYLNWPTVSTLMLLGYLLLTGGSAWCVNAIYNTRETARVNDIRDNKIGIEYHFDVYLLSTFVLLGVALISDYFWLVYLAIPGYIGYLAAVYIVNWVFTETEGEKEARVVAAENALKNQQRKDRKARNKRR